MTSSHVSSVMGTLPTSQVGKVSSFKGESRSAGKGSWGLSLGDHSVNHPTVSLLDNLPELQIKAGVEIGC